MRLLYRLLTLALTPLALIKLQRSETQPGRWSERLGRVRRAGGSPIWIHAASVGEINAARALIEALLNGEDSVLVSTMTVTGAERCRTLFGERVEHRYLPLDNPFAVRRWLMQLRPRAGLVVETEIWPELFLRCKDLGIPLVLVSARLSPSAMKHYRRFAGLYADALSCVALACCQTKTDLERFQSLGLSAERIMVTGNLKFDLEIPADLRASYKAPDWSGRPVWTAGSTRPGEEALLIKAHRQVIEKIPEAVMILAPRHPQRAGEISHLLDQNQLRWCLFGEQPTDAINVVLVDQLGVLMHCYASSRAAFVGGSLVDLGGHNLLEPAILGLPVLAGPFLGQQQVAAEGLRATGGLVQIKDETELASQLKRLLSSDDEAARIGEAARAAVEAGRGALGQTLTAIRPFLNGTASEQSG